MVQRGDTRQYISNGVAEQNFAGQTVNLVNQALNSTQSIAQQANQADIASKQIDLMSEWYKKNNEINTKYQANPTNPQREVELQEAFENLSQKYQVNPFVQGQWNEVKKNVFDKTKLYNSQWQEKQLQTNAQANLKNGYEQLANQISMLGYNGAGIDDVKLTYANGIEALRNGATAVLGEVVAENFLKDSTHDFMTTYISALAQNNPLQAQAFLKDKSVRNDIGRAETLEKLDSYVNNSLVKYNEKVAIGELGNALRAMNSEQADRILSGQADLNEVMKFGETHKSLPLGSINLVNRMYGIGSTNEYTYNENTKKYEKKKSIGSGDGSGSNIKLTKAGKLLMAESLEQELHNLLSFDDEGSLDVKNVKKGNEQQKASGTLVGYMKRVAEAQGKIDEAYAVGAIDASTRKRMMNNYIAPVSDYIESKAGQFDEKWSWGGIAGNKLGYDKVKQAFNTNGLKGEDLRDMQRQKLFAQNYYLDELNQAAQKLGIKNIYEIENLNSHQQKEIYKRASENAIKRAQRWTDKPELFFAKEFPDVYLQPSKFFKANEAKAINHIVAEAVYKRKFEDIDGKSTLDLNDYANIKCREEIKKKYKENQIKAINTLGYFGDMQKQTPKTYDEYVQRIKALGLTQKEFEYDVHKRGLVRRTGNSAMDYYPALLMLEQAVEDKKRIK